MNHNKISDFYQLRRLCVSREINPNNRVLIHGESSSSEVNLTSIRSPEEDINSMRGNIYNLSSKLERSISSRLDQEILEPQSVAALVKLVDSFLKLTDMERLIYESKGSLNKPKDLAEEDHELLEVYKKEMLAPRAGLEPATERLTAACSTTELPRN